MDNLNDDERRLYEHLRTLVEPTARAIHEQIGVRSGADFEAIVYKLVLLAGEVRIDLYERQLNKETDH